MDRRLHHAHALIRPASSRQRARCTGGRPTDSFSAKDGLKAAWSVGRTPIILTNVDDAWRIAIDGVAATIYTTVQMGYSDDEVRSFLVGTMGQAGLEPADDERTRDNLRAIAEAIRQIPQPFDYPVEELERRRSIDEMVGLPSVEHQLTAQLHARELVVEFADRLS